MTTTAQLPTNTNNTEVHMATTTTAVVPSVDVDRTDDGAVYITVDGEFAGSIAPWFSVNEDGTAVVVCGWFATDERRDESLGRYRWYSQAIDAVMHRLDLPNTGQLR